MRRRQLLVFDRFLARVIAVLGDAVTRRLAGRGVRVGGSRPEVTALVGIRLLKPLDENLFTLKNPDTRRLFDGRPRR